ncbi:hypothetical protein ACFVFI_04065 [Streptomyces sp. NPDC057705]|uniref:hypothetical protein n=1 Tax=Streptomyces sp. NPDC057705 TaxID=3346222 RepID=UPI003693FF93
MGDQWHHRDGLHVSPLVATALAHGLLAPSLTDMALPELLQPWEPGRSLITDLTREQAATEAAAHHSALAAESACAHP